MDQVLMSFSKPALDWLRKEAKRLGIPVTEFVRRIVDEKRLGATVGDVREDLLGGRRR